MENPNQDTELGLKKFHLSLFFIHFIQAFLIIFLANNFAVPIVTTFFHINTRVNGVFSSTTDYFTVPLAFLVWLYLIVTAFFHLILLNQRIYQWYQKHLHNNINYIRWVEYAITSSIILTLVALIVGFFDAAGLFLLFWVNVIITFCGFLMERNNFNKKDGVDWLPFIVGSIFGSIPWLVILTYFFGGVYNQPNLPTSINWLIATLLILWAGFPLNMYLHYKKISWFTDYINTEKVYILLGLVTKTLLAWQVLFTFLI